MADSTNYLLGTQADECDRLRFQDQVWEAETEAFLDRLALKAGDRVLEIGSGIGLALPRIAQRVGPQGEVVAIEANAIYALESRKLIKQCRLSNVRVVDGSVLDDPLPDGPFDAIYARWVFSFLADVRHLLGRLRPLLSPGGVMAVVDYNHDGMRLFPAAPALDRVIDAFRAWYAEAGGDLWVAGGMPGALHATGYHCEGLWPHQKAGAPGSATYRWIEQFVFGHGPSLVVGGLLSEAHWNEFVDEWKSCKLDPATVMFSPIVVDVLGRRA